jgi:hypothetical protein
VKYKYTNINICATEVHSIPKYMQSFLFYFVSGLFSWCHTRKCSAYVTYASPPLDPHCVHNHIMGYLYYLLILIIVRCALLWMKTCRLKNSLKHFLSELFSRKR